MEDGARDASAFQVSRWRGGRYAWQNFSLRVSPDGLASAAGSG